MLGNENAASAAQQLLQKENYRKKTFSSQKLEAKKIDRIHVHPNNKRRKPMTRGWNKRQYFPILIIQKKKNKNLMKHY